MKMSEKLENNDHLSMFSTLKWVINESPRELNPFMNVLYFYILTIQ